METFSALRVAVLRLVWLLLLVGGLVSGQPWRGPHQLFTTMNMDYHSFYFTPVTPGDILWNVAVIQNAASGFFPHVHNPGVDGPITSVTAVDDGYTAFNLESQFLFHGGSYSTIYVSTNGYVQFTSMYAYDYSMSYYFRQPRIGIFADLRRYVSGSYHHIWTEKSTTPHRVIVEGRHISFYGKNDLVSFQIELVPSTGTVAIHFLNVDNVSRQMYVGINSGSSATSTRLNLLALANPPPVENIGAVRLVGGVGPYEGRVEIFNSFSEGDTPAWGTVCDDDFDNVDAATVCRQLGYPSAAAQAVSGYFPSGKGHILMRRVACTMSHNNLIDCPSDAPEVANANCNHYEDVGVRCLSITPSPIPGCAVADATNTQIGNCYYTTGSCQAGYEHVASLYSSPYCPYRYFIFWFLYYGDCNQCCQVIRTPTCKACQTGFTLSPGSTACADVNECNNNPCYGGNGCVNTYGGYICQDCPPGTHGNGQICTPCDSDHWGFNCEQTCNGCNGNGVCHPTTGVCQCYPGYTGINCENGCGNGIKDGTEECDGGPCCTNDCKLHSAGTLCESDGNPCTADACTADGECSHSDNGKCFCGNGIVDPGEACDNPGAQPGCDYGVVDCQVCDSACQFVSAPSSYCGDGVVDNTFETCDDGNTQSSDGCSSTCQLEVGFTCGTPGSSCETCSPGKFGYNCASTSNCENGASTNVVTGACTCVAPWIGAICSSLPPPAASDVTAVNPSTIIVGTAPSITLTGAFPSDHTVFGFVAKDGSCSSGLVGLTNYYSGGDELGGAVTVCGEYELCLSTNDGQVFVKQTSAGIIPFVPPTPTATTVTSLFPSQIIEGSSPVFAIGLSSLFESSTTKISFSTSSTCASGFLAVTNIPVETNGVLTLSGTLTTNMTPYYLCLSVDEGDTWVAQTSVSLTVDYPPPDFKDVGSISPSEWAIHELPSITLKDEMGAVIPPAASKYFAFVHVTEECGPTTNLAVTQLTTNPVSISNTLPSVGYYALCYSTNDQADYVKQVYSATIVKVKPPAATTTSITQIMPNSILANTGSTITFANAVGSEDTMVAFTLSDCSPFNLVNIRPLPSGNAAAVPPFGVVGTYFVCYSTNSGATYFKQESLELDVEPPAPTATSLTLVHPGSITRTNIETITFYGSTPSEWTRIGFSKTGDCASPIDVQTLNGKDTLSINSLDYTAGVYSVCYSTDSGNNFVKQDLTSLSILPVPAAMGSITAIVPDHAEAFEVIPNFAATGAELSPWTWIAFTKSPDPSCSLGYNGGRVLATRVTADPIIFDGSFTETGLYWICYSTDDGASWVLQETTGSKVLVMPPDATLNSVSFISPQLIKMNEPAQVSLVGGVPSATSFFAFVSNVADCNNPGKLVSVTPFTYAQSQISSPISVPGKYSVCYSTDGGDTFVGQVHSNVTVTVLPSPAVRASITILLTPDNDPNTLVVGELVDVTAVGAVPSERSYLKITSNADCYVIGGSEIHYTAHGSSMLDALTSAGTYRICYSTDGGVTWVLQELQLTVLPPAATANSITEIRTYLNDPYTYLSNQAYVTEFVQSLQFIGAFSSDSSYVLLVAQGAPCGSEGELLEDDLLEVYGFLGIAKLEVCYSTRGSFVKQQNLLLDLIPFPASTSSINGIRLDDQTSFGTFVTLLAATTGQTVDIRGAVASPDTKVAFVPLRIGGCPSGKLESIVTLSSLHGIPVAALSEAGAYALCYVVGDGDYVLQTGVSIQVTPPPPTFTTVTGIITDPIRVVVGESARFTIEGLFPSTSTIVAFVEHGNLCMPPTGSSRGNLLLRTLYDDEGQFFPPFTAAGLYSICVSVSPANTLEEYILQGEVELEVFPETPNPDSINSLAPPEISSNSIVDVSFVGAIPSAYSKIALTLKSDCSDFVAEYGLESSTVVTLTNYASGDYTVCYSTDLGNNWYKQNVVLSVFDVDPCDAEPCQHGGTCITEPPFGFTCDCPIGWEGAQCHVETDECASNPCANGVCHDMFNSYYCQCNVGWVGDDCDIALSCPPVTLIMSSYPETQAGKTAVGTCVNTNNGDPTSSSDLPTRKCLQIGDNAVWDLDFEGEACGKERFDPTITPGSQNGSLFTVPEDSFTGEMEIRAVCQSDSQHILVQPSHGSLKKGFTELFYVYTPEANYNGPDHFRYYCANSNLGRVAYWKIDIFINVTPINDAPVAHTMYLYINEDNPLHNFQLSAYDPDDDELTFSTSVTEFTGISEFNLTSSGLFSCVPALNYVGKVTIPYTVTDGSLFGAGVLEINVMPVNDAPYMESRYYFAQITHSVNPVLVSTLPLIYDPDADDAFYLSASVDSQFNSTVALSTSQITDTNTAVTFSFYPDLYYPGVNSFVVRVEDSAGAAHEATHYVWVGVDPPTPSFNDIVYGPNGKVLNIEGGSGSGGNRRRASDGRRKSQEKIASRDDDEPSNQEYTGTTLENIPISFILVRQSAEHFYSITVPPVFGTATITNNDTTAQLTYVSHPQMHGVDTFEINSLEGIMAEAYLFKITVEYVNDPPTPLETAWTIEEDTAIFERQLMTSDPESGVANIKYTLLKKPNHSAQFKLTETGLVSYVPEENYYGKDNFIYRVYDELNAATIVDFQLTITSVNDVPVAFTDAANWDTETGATVMEANATCTDADDEDLTFIFVRAIPESRNATVSISEDGLISSAELKGVAVVFICQDPHGAVSNEATFTFYLDRDDGQNLQAASLSIMIVFIVLAAVLLVILLFFLWQKKYPQKWENVKGRMHKSPSKNLEPAMQPTVSSSRLADNDVRHESIEMLVLEEKHVSRTSFHSNHSGSAQPRSSMGGLGSSELA